MKSSLRNTLSGRGLLAGAVLALALSACTAPAGKKTVEPAAPVDSHGEPLAAYTPHWPGMQGRGLP